MIRKPNNIIVIQVVNRMDRGFVCDSALLQSSKVLYSKEVVKTVVLCTP